VAYSYGTFRVLGTFELTDTEGRTVTPRSNKLRSILAMLCFNANRVVSTEQLSKGLWENSPPRTSVTALQVYISKLRKHFEDCGIGAGVLRTKAPGYLLDLSGHVLDLDVFESLGDRSLRAERAGRAEDASRLLGQALALWRGPALADLPAVPLLGSIARQIDERRMVAFERRFDLELALGRHTALVSELYGLVDSYPLWENLHFSLMLALYRSGRTVESLNVYNAFRTSLRDALGMDPGARLRSLQVAILNREEWLEGPERSRVGVLAAAAAD
jgi:DNA-binding SARP family transcriptional activator